MSREELLKTALSNWQDRLANLELAKSITSDPNKRFDLDKQIEYCRDEVEKALKNVASDLGNTEIRENLKRSQEQPLLDSPAGKPSDEDSAGQNEAASKRVATDTILASSLYTQKLEAWQRSSCQDRSNLLAERALDHEIERVTLNPVDVNTIEHVFLVESIIWERNRDERELFEQHWAGHEKLLKPDFKKAIGEWKKSSQKQHGSLLRGSVLRKATDWASNNRLSQQERIFLIASIVEEADSTSMISEADKIEVSKLVQKDWPEFSRRTQDPYAVLREILTWTECQPFLTSKICKFVSLSDASILRGEEKKRIRAIVTSQFNKDTEDSSISRHFHEIYSLIARNSTENSFWLLFSYRKVLKKQRFGEGYEEIRNGIRFLEGEGLLIEKKAELEVRSCIYKSVFNEDWAEKNILSLRPYAEKFLNWLDSSCQDDTQLLNAQEVQEGMQWAQNNSDIVTPLENKFLVYSLDM